MKYWGWRELVFPTLIAIGVLGVIVLFIYALVTGNGGCDKGMHSGITGWVWTGKQMSPVIGCVPNK